MGKHDGLLILSNSLSRKTHDGLVHCLKVLKNAGLRTRTVVSELERTLSSLQNSGKLNCEACCSMQG